MGVKLGKNLHWGWV